MDKKKLKNMNYYKIATYVLLIIIVLIGAFYLLNYYSNVKMTQGAIYGQQTVSNAIFNELNEKGYVTFNLGENESLTLVPSIYVQNAKEQTILEIMDLIEKDGSVTLYNNDTELILVPYTQPEMPMDLGNMELPLEEVNE
jgi:hypothetical protein